jgi:hypothetical protein
MESQDFQKTDAFGPVTKLTRTVNTTMPANPDGSGYTTEENRQVVYEIGEFYVEVSKVSDRGWSVTRYDPDGIDKMNMDYYDEEQKAHRVAREMVEEASLELSAQD